MHLHTLVAFTKSSDICGNCTAYWRLGLLLGLLGFFPSQSNCYFGKAKHIMQTGLNTVLTVHGIQPILVKLLRYVCLCNVSSGRARTLTDGKSDTQCCE